jgi:hypothetical protein
LNGSPTQVRKIFAPERAKGEVIQVDKSNFDSVVSQMADKLSEWDLITFES